MKKILSTALAIVLFVGASQAQDVAKEGRHGKHGNMFKELNLTADQQAKIKSIREAEKNEMKSLKNDGKSDADKAARKQLHDKYKTQFESVLTEEQKAKFKEERKGHHDEAFKGDRKGGGREFGKNLNLSDDQKTKVASLNSDFKSKIDAVKNNSALSQDAKRDEFKKLMQSHRNNLRSVLTQEQIAKMDEARKNHKKIDPKNL